MKNKTISEYGYIYYDKPKNLTDKFIHQNVTKDEFNELYQYWKENDEAKSVFEYNGYNYLKAQNYVGIIQTKSLSVEILPKIYDNNSDENSVRTIFTEMLKPLLNINEVQINKANLSTTKNKNIYEMFIAMFIEHIDKLIHRGLKSQYIAKEDNQFFLKGKLKFNQHIKQNYIHKERFYVEFDEYLQDRVENRLLKSTIELLLKKTNDYVNKRALRQQLFIFDEVRLSTNHDIDISKINIHRGMEYYEMPLRFAKVFLKHQSFTSLRGKDNVFALLFPMETVFENYIEFVLNNSKDILGIKNVLVNGYSGDYLLGGGECNLVGLQPDYLLALNDDTNIVTDAKWKLYDMDTDKEDCVKANISSSDVYQVFSYLHYYDARNTAYLFVPDTNSTEIVEFVYNFHKNKKTCDIPQKKIKIIPIPLAEVINDGHRIKDKFWD